MVVEHDTIEEYVEVLSTFDSSDQLRLIAELTKRLADSAVEVTDTSEATEVGTVRKEKKADTSPVKRLDFDQDNYLGQNEPVGGGASHSEERGKRVVSVDNKLSDALKAASNLTLDDLFGAWEDIDKGWDKPIEEVIRKSRTSKADFPNFDS